MGELFAEVLGETLTAANVSDRITFRIDKIGVVSLKMGHVKPIGKLEADISDLAVEHFKGVLTGVNTAIGGDLHHSVSHLRCLVEGKVVVEVEVVVVLTTRIQRQTVLLFSHRHEID